MSNLHPTFKQYVHDLAESKKQLVEALQHSPIVCETYEVINYCRLTAGENTQNKYTIPLKPGVEITIKRRYEDENTPIPQSFLIKTLEENTNHRLYWNEAKLLKWLNKNTK